MDNKKLYETAKGFALKIKEENPNFVLDFTPSICIIIDENDMLFNGVTGVKISDGELVCVCPTNNAIMSMIVEDSFKAKKIIIVNFNEHEIMKPSAECLELILRADDENRQCEVVLSTDQSCTIAQLLSADESVERDESEKAQISVEEVEPDDDEVSAKESEPADELSDTVESDKEIDEEPSADIEQEIIEDELDILSDLGAPAEFASEVEIDESNPFYEPPVSRSSNSEPEIKVLYETHGGDASSTKDSENEGKSVEEMLKDAKKRKKNAKKFTSFFKRSSKD